MSNPIETGDLLSFVLFDGTMAEAARLLSGILFVNAWKGEPGKLAGVDKLIQHRAAAPHSWETLG